MHQVKPFVTPDSYAITVVQVMVLSKFSVCLGGGPGGGGGRSASSTTRGMGVYRGVERGAGFGMIVPAQMAQDASDARKWHASL